MVQVLPGVRHYDALGGRMHGLLEGRTPHVVGDGKCRRFFVGKIPKSQTRPKSCRAEVLKLANDHMGPAGRINQTARHCRDQKGPEKLAPPLLLLHPPGAIAIGPKSVNKKFQVQVAARACRVHTVTECQ